MLSRVPRRCPCSKTGQCGKAGLHEVVLTIRQYLEHLSRVTHEPEGHWYLSVQRLAVRELQATSDDLSDKGKPGDSGAAAQHGEHSLKYSEGY